MVVNENRLNGKDCPKGKEMDYSVEPLHSKRLIVQGAQPFNAEPSVRALVQQGITPDELVYCRNHSKLRFLVVSLVFGKLIMLVTKVRRYPWMRRHSR